MNTWLRWTMAQVEVDMDHFRELLGQPTEAGFDSTALQNIALIALAIGLLFLLLTAINRLAVDWRRQGPAFRRVASQLGLSRTEWRTVSRAAHAAGRVHPLTLLVSSGMFDRAAARLENNPDRTDDLSAIRAKVFG